jgi:hypothetical protein
LYKVFPMGTKTLLAIERGELSFLNIYSKTLSNSVRRIGNYWKKYVHHR